LFYKPIIERTKNL